MAEKERTKFFSRGPTSSGLIQENSTFIKMKNNSFIERNQCCQLWMFDE